MKKLALPLLLFLASCSPSTLSLSKVHLTSQKGLTQTLTAKERLKPFENDSYILHQPHIKVIRVYEGKSGGKTIVSTYHPSGHIYQLLECINNQAYGVYKEWGPNGSLKISAKVVGGAPELEESGMKTWIFHGENQAFDDDGHLVASFFYSEGRLEGESRLYYGNGTLKETLPYINGDLHGEVRRYNLDGECIEKQNYSKGVQDGLSVLYRETKSLASDERFLKGKLISGHYFNPVGQLISQIKEGTGFRIIWHEDGGYDQVEFCQGSPEGLVLCYDKNKTLKLEYSQKGGKKHGPETLYYPSSRQAKLCVHWSQGLVHGTTTSWYPNGRLESEREMSQNKKHGVLTARYEDSSLMLIEEYDRDQLTRGQYFKKGSPHPISTIENGRGVAHLYDSRGLLLQKVEYVGGKPVE